MNQERDKYLTEVVLGIRYRKPTHGSCCTCQVCGYGYDECVCVDFSTPEGFFKLWNACREKEWWEEFLDEGYGDIDLKVIVINLIQPDRFADAVYEFWKERGMK